MSKMGNHIIAEADRDSLGHADEINRLNNIIALLRARIRRQDGRWRKPWHEDVAWWSQQNESHDEQGR